MTDPASNLWSVTSEFLKSQATRLERDLPWTLDSARPEQHQDCQTGNHSRSSPQTKHVNATKAKNYEEQKMKVGTCPQCGDYHSFIVRFNTENISANLRSCESFTSLSPKDRAEVVRSNKICAMCLDWRHERSACQKPKRTCKKKDGGERVSKAPPGALAWYHRVLREHHVLQEEEQRAHHSPQPSLPAHLLPRVPQQEHVPRPLHRRRE